MVMGDSGGGRKQKPRSQTGAASEPAKVGPNGKASLRLAAHCTRLNRPQVRVSLTLALAPGSRCSSRCRPRCRSRESVSIWPQTGGQL